MKKSLPERADRSPGLWLGPVRILLGGGASPAALFLEIAFCAKRSRPTAHGCKVPLIAISSILPAGHLEEFPTEVFLIPFDIACRLATARHGPIDPSNVR
jgi:hypothetical protein